MAERVAVMAEKMDVSAGAAEKMDDLAGKVDLLAASAEKMAVLAATAAKGEGTVEVMAEPMDEYRENSKMLTKTLNTNLQLNSDASVNLRDILQKDSSQAAQKKNLEKLRKRTNITKIIVNDNMSMDNANNNGNLNRAKSEPPATIIEGYVEDGSSESSSGSPGHSSGEGSGRAERKKAVMTPEERRIWGKVCTGTYGRAMEKFNGKGSSEGRKNSSLSEKTRRKSSPAMPPTGC